MRILLTYASSHGQTERVAQRIAARLRSQGATVLVTAHPDGVNPADFDGILVGARNHGSRYPSIIRRFVHRNVEALRTRPSAFFSVSLLQLALDRTTRRRAEELPARFCHDLGWRPDRTIVIGGALRWRQQYGRLAPLFKWIWRHSLGEKLDLTAEEQIFTDWAAVDRFATSFVEIVRDRARDTAEPSRTLRTPVASIEA